MPHALEHTPVSEGDSHYRRTVLEKGVPEDCRIIVYVTNYGLLETDTFLIARRQLRRDYIISHLA